MNTPRNGHRKKRSGRTAPAGRRVIGDAAPGPVALHHTMLDCILVTRGGATMGRPFAACAIDVATREIVAFRLSASRHG